MTSRIQPNTIEETRLHIAQHVGNGHNIQNQAELQQHNELRHCWLPGQNNSLPFLIKNKTTRKHTHTPHNDDRLIMWTFSNFNISTHPNLLNFQSKTSTSWHYIFKTFCKYWLHNLRCFASPDFASSNSIQLQANFWLCRWDFHSFCKQIQLQANFGYDGGVSTLYANNFNFKLHALASLALLPQPSSSPCHC